MRSAGTPNFCFTASTSRVSLDIVFTSVTRSSTNCARSLSPVEITNRQPSPFACSARDREHRPAERRDGLLERSDLGGEVVRHRRAVRLVLRVRLVAEGLAGGGGYGGGAPGPCVRGPA